MSIDFQIQDVLKEAWGFAPSVQVSGPPSKREMESWAGLGGYEINARNEGSAGIYGRRDVEISSLGTDVMFPFWLGGDNLKIFDKVTGKLEWVWAEEFQIPVATLLNDISRQKEIVKTRMSAGYGTVKELYSFGDWRLSIKGLLFDEHKNERTMIEMRRKLLSFEQYADSIPVRGWLFDELGIDRIVINSISFKQIQGRPWMMPFDMSCESDSNPNLII